MKRVIINYKPFDMQTSSSEDLYLFAFYSSPLKNLLTHYDADVRKESRKLKSLGIKKARVRVRRYFKRNGY